MLFFSSNISRIEGYLRPLWPQSTWVLAKSSLCNLTTKEWQHWGTARYEFVLEWPVKSANILYIWSSPWKNRIEIILFHDLVIFGQKSLVIFWVELCVVVIQRYIQLTKHHVKPLFRQPREVPFKTATTSSWPWTSAISKGVAPRWLICPCPLRLQSRNEPFPSALRMLQHIKV